MKKINTNEGVSTVKKTMLVMALAVVLVLAFAATAMALGSIPNRSSAFLTTIPTPGQLNAGGAYTATDTAYYNQIRGLSAGGTKAAYITWGEALAAMDTTNVGGGSGLTAAQKASPHGNYATTTVKCQVCHSVHKASINGSFLLPGTNGCIACHGSTTYLTTVKVAAGTSLDNRHGGLTSCNSYLCHSESPHGADVTEYAAGASVLLSDWSDFLTGAAVKSGLTAAGPVNAVKTNVNMDGYIFDSLTVAVYQPGLDNTELTALNTAGDLRGIAIQTGYTCANDGCHMNGSFNGLSENAYLGDYKLNLGGVTTALYGFDNATGATKAGYTDFQSFDDPDASSNTANVDYNVANGIFGSQDLRTMAIKGHELYSTFGGAVADDPTTLDVDEHAPQLAWAASGTCRACHDQVDARIAGATQTSALGNSFPHGNTEWRAVVGGDPAATIENGVNGMKAQTLASYGWTAEYNNAAWFKIADYQGGTYQDTNVRRPQGSAATFTYAPRTVAMDGACLKCHKSANSGVGIDY